MSIDVYAAVTDRIIAALDEGTVPWHKPWRTTGSDWPCNIEGRRYRGINVLLLGLMGYESPVWLTFKQAKERGGSVRKGEHSTMVVFWKTLRVTEEKDGKQVQKTVPMLRYYNVFNIAQTDGVKLPARFVDGPATTVDPIEAAESIVDRYLSDAGPALSWGADSAYYLPKADRIHVPARDSFTSSEAVYDTLFHELGHSTGHPNRLDRDGIARFDHHGSDRYGREELVAELTSAFLCAEAGIEPERVQSAAYIAGWVASIRADKRAVVVAAGAAQRAADLILGRQAEAQKAAA